ncbi:sulfite exporter TauE/SafE family protein [Siccirubricoccus sp. G192]|nr:sulfite exporter TauE/SafE family protein [Siccirubricoccus sp. G192]
MPPHPGGDGAGHPVSGLIAALPQGAGLAWLLGAALAGGLARGFSGFGAALIFVPLASVALGPQRAAPLMLVMEAVAIAALTPGAWRLADRREVGWLSLGALLGTPIGAAVLVAADPLALRWGVAGVILALLGLVMSGWRFRGRPAPPLAIGVGLAGGVLGGVAMVSGPPVIAYLLGREATAQRVRASFALYLAAGGVVAGLAYAVAGLLTPALLAPFLVAAPAYGLGIWGGVRVFGLASEHAFRLACYAMIALAALLSLPAWDGVLR